MRLFNGPARILFLFLAAMGLQAPVLAATFNVSDAAGLRAALLTAATNGQDDVIVLAAGTYPTGGTTFTFVTNENKSLTIQGANGTTRDQVVLDGGGTSQVLKVDCVGSCGAITLQGLTVQNGNAGVSGSGGAMYSFLGIGIVTVTNSTFSSNSAGGCGAIFSLYVTVTNSIFSNNTAGESGGAICGGGTVNVTNSTFSNNTASERGGAIYDFAGNITVTNSTFSSNSSNSSGTFISFGGGAIFASYVTVTNSTFSNNTAAEGGGAIWGDAVNVTNSTFSNNSAGSDGGAIFGANLIVTVTNSIFSSNTSKQEGGAIRGASTVVNNTFSGNSAPFGAAISSLYSSSSIINSVFYGHTTPALSAGSPYNLYNNLIDTSAGIAGSIPIMVGNVAPAATSPFVNAASGNFRLAAGSLAIDAGLDPNSTTFENLVGSSNVAEIRKALLTDLAGNPRPTRGTAVDIGAYEFLPDADCLFNWAERVYPNLFAPAGAVSQTLAPYYYRYYSQTDAYLGTSSVDNHVYYKGPATNYSIVDEGALTTWLPMAGCQ